MKVLPHLIDVIYEVARRAGNSLISVPKEFGGGRGSQKVKYNDIRNRSVLLI